MGDDTNVLECRDLAVSFGGIRALNNVSVNIPHGAVSGVIGPNGAGKTTFIDAITGFVNATGSIRLGAREISRLKPHKRMRAGLARSWQSLELFDDLSVQENLRVAVDGRRETKTRRLSLRASDDLGTERVLRVMITLGIEHYAAAMPTELSQGQRKLVGVARALASRPTLLCLDEPGAGLDTTESVELAATIRAIADSGTSVLLIDHDMDLVLGLCSQLWVFDFGQVIASGSPDAIRNDPKVIEAYLGSGAERSDA